MTSSQRKYRYILESDVRGSVELPDEPLGWDSRTSSLRRSAKYHGVARESAGTLGFIRSGKDYVDSVIEARGINGIIDITILALGTDGKYTLDFQGELSLKTYDQQPAVTYCLLVQTGFVQKFQAREKQVLNLEQLTSLNGTDLSAYAQEKQLMTLHSRGIKKVYEAKGDGATGSLITSERRLYIYPSFGDVVTNEMEVSAPQGTGTLDPVEIENYLHKVTDLSGVYLVKIKYHLELRNIGTSDWQEDYQANVRVVINDNTYLVPHTFSEAVVDNEWVGTLETDLFEVVADLLKGDAVYTFLDITFPPGSDVIQSNLKVKTLPTSTLYLEAVTLDEESTTEGTMIYEGLNRMVEQITDSAAPLRSSVFGRTDSEPIAYTSDGEYSHNCLLSGSQIRTEDRSLSISFEHAFSSLNSIYNVGVGIEAYGFNEMVVIEKLEHFYQKTQMVDGQGNRLILHGQADKPSRKPALDYYYHEAKVGYTQWETEGTNGKDEPNTKHSYSMPVRNHDNSYNKLSRLVTSSYAIEQTRRKRQQPTEDYKYDDAVFMINLVRDGADFKPRKNEGFEEVTNLTAPESAYNLDLSPKRCLLRHGNVLKGSLIYEETEGARFIEGQGNTGMVTRKATEMQAVAEDGSIAAGDLPAPLWIPIIVQDETSMDQATYDLIKEQMYKVIGYERDGVIENYYLMDMQRTADNKATFKLLKANG